ncbi:unnamed protein product, partial [Ectocarpus fasciculatus]
SRHITHTPASASYLIQETNKRNEAPKTFEFVISGRIEPGWIRSHGWCLAWPSPLVGTPRVRNRQLPKEQPCHAMPCHAVDAPLENRKFLPATKRHDGVFFEQ